MRGSYDQLAATMDEKVDAYLGNDVWLALDGINFGDAPVKAFVLAEHGASGFAAIDDLVQRWTLKISKTLMPQPSLDVRLRCPAVLGEGTWQPAGEFQSGGGRYWLCDLQKATGP